VGCTLSIREIRRELEPGGLTFKKAVTLEKWVQAVKGVREPLGKLNSRKLSTTQAVNDPPGAPAGQYVICLFDSNFENQDRRGGDDRHVSRIRQTVANLRIFHQVARPCYIDEP
jgi:hypothetical protein